MVSAAVSTALEKAAKRAARVAEKDAGLTLGDGSASEASFPNASQSAALEKAKQNSRPAIKGWLIGLYPLYPIYLSKIKLWDFNFQDQPRWGPAQQARLADKNPASDRRLESQLQKKQVDQGIVWGGIWIIPNVLFIFGIEYIPIYISRIRVYTYICKWYKKNQNIFQWGVHS